MGFFGCKAGFVLVCGVGSFYPFLYCYHGRFACRCFYCFNPFYCGMGEDEEVDYFSDHMQEGILWHGTSVYISDEVEAT